jgi:DNA-binding beta-propeller fold protein YncE
MDADRDSLWLARASTREVVRVDRRKRRVVATLRVAGTPTSLAVASSGIWVGLTDDDGRATLARYTRSGALKQALAVREGIGGIVSAGGLIWVVKAATNKVARIRAGGDELTDWASLPGDIGSMSYGDGALWLTLPAEDAVAKVEARTGRSVVGSAGRAPARALVAGGRVFVASRNDHTVVVLEPEALRPEGAPIKVGLNPSGMATDGRSVWVTGVADNSLTRIDPR